MARPQILLEQYLEGISWKAMEQYPDVIQKLIRGKSGVYALYDGDTLYYVGLASNLMGRLKGHVRDRHKGLWSRFSVYLTARREQSHIRELEALLLRIAKPTGNRVSGRLRAATDLSPTLAATMTDHDANRRAELLGGAVAKRLQRRQTRNADKRRRASVPEPRRAPLRSTYKGEVYSAVLRKDGRVQLDGILYPSLSAAAQVIARRPVNGRWFWRMKVGGEWVRLKKLDTITR